MKAGGPERYRELFRSALEHGEELYQDPGVLGPEMERIGVRIVLELGELETQHVDLVRERPKRQDLTGVETDASGA